MFQRLDDTIVAISTPPGIGAVAMIRVSGNEAFGTVQKLWKGKRLEKMDSHTVHLGSITSLSGKIIDECVLTIFRSPQSYTKEDTIELSCHGSVYIQESILHELILVGARLAGPGEFTMRAFLNGRMDLTQAEAVADLISAQQEQEHENAVKQMKGGFSKDLKLLRDELLGFVALLELELDFGEEDVEFAKRDDLKKLLNNIQDHLKLLIQSFDWGNVMKYGVPITIVGRPNAGKSTLLNSILNEERAIVSDIAGTTRDTIEEGMTINGIYFRFTDTAGIRQTLDLVEGIGVERAISKALEAGLVLYVFDVTTTSKEDILHDLNTVGLDFAKVLLLANKMDKNPYVQPTEFIPEGLSTDQLISISAINSMNIPYLKEWIYNKTIEGKINSDMSIITNVRHKEALIHANESLNRLGESLYAGLTGDIIAMDAKEALIQLGKITGEVGVEELLGNIFGRFCIGK